MNALNYHHPANEHHGCNVGLIRALHIRMNVALVLKTPGF